MKKALSILLASSCAVTLAAPTFAADPVYSGEVTIETLTATPTINVVIPTETGVVINPYKLEVTQTVGTASLDGDDSVISAELEIANNSDLGIKLYVTPTAEAKGEAAIVKVPIDAESTKKQIFLFLEAADATGGQTKVFDEANLAADANTGLTEAGDQAFQFLFNGKKTCMGVVADGASKFVQIFGDANGNTTTPWAAEDGVNMSMVYDYIPVANGSGNAGGGAGGGVTPPAGFTAAVNDSEITFSDSAFTLGALTANDTYALTVNSGSYSAAYKPTFTGYTINSASSDDTSVVQITTGLAANKDKMDVQNTGTCTVTYNLTKTADSSTVTVKFAVTVS